MNNTTEQEKTIELLKGLLIGFLLGIGTVIGIIASQAAGVI